MNDKRLAIMSALIAVEKELRLLQLWRVSAPSAEALQSVAPFAVDTLTLPEWLQYIFLPKIKVLLDNNQPLPKKCHILPMAQMFFQASPLNTAGILTAIERVDTLMKNEVA